MGNHRFRFSDMIPNAWFYKLKDMNKHRNHHPKTLNSTNKKHSTSSSLSSSSLSSSLAPPLPEKPHLSDQRKSYYFTRDLLTFPPDSPIKPPVSDKQSPAEQPRKSARRRRSTKRSRRQPPRVVSSSNSAGCRCRATVESVWTKPGPDSSPSSSDLDSVLTEFGSDRGRTPETFDGGLSCSSSCKCTTENDIVIDMIDGDKAFGKLDHLPRIITKENEPTKIQRTSAEFSERNKYGSLSVKVVKEKIVTSTSPVRRLSVTSSSPGVKLRLNSPRIANRRIQGRKSASSNSISSGARRSVTESFAVVKSSMDPRRDFRESMVEMILENNIRASKDLEELLACYLSLNSDEYHDLIINVFKQIWFDFIHRRFK